MCDLLAETSDDDTPSDASVGLGPVDLEGGLSRAYEGVELGSRVRTDQHGLRWLVEDVVDRPDQGCVPSLDASHNAADAICSEKSQAFGSIEIEHLGRTWV